MAYEVTGLFVPHTVYLIGGTLCLVSYFKETVWQEDFIAVILQWEVKSKTLKFVYKYEGKQFHDVTCAHIFLSYTCSSIDSALHAMSY